MSLEAVGCNVAGPMSTPGCDIICPLMGVSERPNYYRTSCIERQKVGGCGRKGCDHRLRPVKKALPVHIAAPMDPAPVVEVVAEVKVRKARPRLVCSEAGCESVTVGRGLCKLHYARWWKQQHRLIGKAERQKKETLVFSGEQSAVVRAMKELCAAKKLGSLEEFLTDAMRLQLKQEGVRW